MRFSVRGLDASFIYPLTKADVREAFGNDLLTLAWLGGFSVDHFFNRRETPGKITGRVILTVSVSWSTVEDRPTAYLQAYRVPKEEWSDYLHWQAREVMRAEVRPWVEAMIVRPETEWGPPEERLIELREGVLRLHRHRPR